MFGSEQNLTTYKTEGFILGEPVENTPSLEQNLTTYSAKGFVLGEPVEENAVLLSSDDTTVESFLDRTAPRVEHLGVEDALKQGILRQATMEDVSAWVEAHVEYIESSLGKAFSSAKERETYKAKLIDELKPEPSSISTANSYVVLGNFTYPAGLYAYNPSFFVPEGVPKPSGQPGFSSVHDSSGKCLSTICSINVGTSDSFDHESHF